MRTDALRLTLVLLLALSLYSVTLAQNGKVKVDTNTFGAIEARHIGPAITSGRIAAIYGVARDPRILWIRAAGGGVWKSINGGTSFKPVFDKYSQSIGA